MIVSLSTYSFDMLHSSFKSFSALELIVLNFQHLFINQTYVMTL